MKNKFDDLLKKMDLNYFGTGTHKVSLNNALELKKKNEVFILDVRTKEENEYVVIPFAYNIPTSEIVDRIDELPKDQIIAVFCSSATRATIVYAYLTLLDYDVKIILDSIGEIGSKFGPGFVLKNASNPNK